jgi:hypothetical protein
MTPKDIILMESFRMLLIENNFIVNDINIDTTKKNVIILTAKLEDRK